MAFGSHWRRLVEGFLSAAKPLNALLIPYEDLVSGSFSLDILERHLDVSIDHSLLDVKIRGSRKGAADISASRLEEWLLWRTVRKTACRIQYERP